METWGDSNESKTWVVVFTNAYKKIFVFYFPVTTIPAG
jgi:hypothetical protein